jgi:hypothetical protein
LTLKELFGWVKLCGLSLAVAIVVVVLYVLMRVYG